MLPIILSGGSGTRLWPLSRQQYPKQFLPITGDDTLFQQTVNRLSGLAGVVAPLVVCNEAHRFLAAEQFRQLGIDHQGILLEPCARNTAPAITLAALQAQQQGDGQAVLLVLPADHVIRDRSAFHTAINTAAALAQQGHLVTFGIVPEYAETGYGYIRMGEKLKPDTSACRVDAFVEKPEQQTADGYLQSGEYRWNSGMFMFRADVLLAEMTRYQPGIVTACQQSLAKAEQDLDFIRVDEAAFATTPDLSLDYAVMEHTEKAVVVSLDAGWSDVGAWDAVWRLGEPDEAGNVVRGDVMVQDAADNLVYADKRLVSLLGVDGLVVVETEDAVLVADRQQAQDIKPVVARLKAAGYPQASTHREVHRPWGSYDCIDAGERFQVKRIRVKPGASLSLQKHFHRAEHWVVVRGSAQVTCGDDTFLLHENQSTYIPLGTVHRLANPGKVMLELIEVQSGAYLGEDDIVRLDDVYGRKGMVDG